MIVSIDHLKPLEKVFLYHLKNLSEMILKEGIVHTPIIADKKSGIVLDGSHRYIFFLMNGFEEVQYLLLKSFQINFSSDTGKLFLRVLGDQLI